MIRPIDIEAKIAIETRNFMDNPKRLWLQVGTVSRNLYFGVVCEDGDLEEGCFFEELSEENAIHLRDILNFLLPPGIK